jgi:hypothetical protein
VCPAHPTAVALSVGVSDSSSILLVSFSRLGISIRRFRRSGKRERQKLPAVLFNLRPSAFICGFVSLLGDSGDASLISGGDFERQRSGVHSTPYRYRLVCAQTRARRRSCFVALRGGIIHRRGSENTERNVPLSSQCPLCLRGHSGDALLVSGADRVCFRQIPWSAQRFLPICRLPLALGRSPPYAPCPSSRKARRPAPGPRLFAG